MNENIVQNEGLKTNNSSKKFWNWQEEKLKQEQLIVIISK